MPAFVNLPWLQVSPRDFVEAALAGARAGMAASKPRTVNSGLPFVSGGGTRPETELQKAQAALALARTNQIQNEIANPQSPAPPPLLKYQATGEGGPPGTLNRETGEFTPNPFYTAKPVTQVGPKVSTVPVLIPGKPNEITGETSDRVVSIAPDIARSILTSGPDTVRTNQFNVGVLKGLQSLQPPGQTNAPSQSSAAVTYRFIPGKGIVPIVTEETDQTAKPGTIFFGNPEDAPAEEPTPGFNIQE